jgi:sugar lactone lactonase YvrE
VRRRAVGARLQGAKEDAMGKVCPRWGTAAVAAVLLGSGISRGEGYTTRVVAQGLSRPVGIALEGNDTIYFTEIPTPGVAGGANAVKRLELDSCDVETLHMGEPEPVNIALDRQGNVYWTCKSAGVILKQDEDGTTQTLLDNLQKPSGIAVDRNGRRVYFTEIPSPGVPGAGNKVSVLKGSQIAVLHEGEPEPTDIVVRSDGALYWTCKSAGVILAQIRGETTTLLDGLDNPVGIALDRRGRTLFFTEVPTPGVPGSAGGRNKVWELDLITMERRLVDEGDPQPTDVAVARNGNVYWTCTSAGVIVEARPLDGPDCTE